jgi:cytochrome oxidase Cu insertion factor (SCO1/SenC/PrrC family)
MIEAGARAPKFTLPDQDGKEVSLSDFAGRTVVLVFYPADFSPVCTDQLNAYQEVLGELEERGLTLLGVSVDSAWTHKAFQAHLIDFDGDLYGRTLRIDFLERLRGERRFETTQALVDQMWRDVDQAREIAERAATVSRR